jgi:hypothetical protein
LQGAGIAENKLKEIYKEKGADSIDKQQALVHDNQEAAFYAGKIAAAKFFALDALSTVKARCEAIKVGDKMPIEMADESFTI